jgi:hypothetical protein
MSRKKGNKYEKLASKMLEKSPRYSDIKETINSGAFYHSKGDRTAKDKVFKEEYLIEIKGTGKSQYRLSNKIVEKIWNEALEIHKIPLILILIATEHERNLLVVRISNLTANKETDKQFSKTINFKLDKIDEMIKQPIYLQGIESLWHLNVSLIKEVF